MTARIDREQTKPGLGALPDEALPADRSSLRVRTPITCMTPVASVRPAQRWAARRTMPVPFADEPNAPWPDAQTGLMPACLDEVGPATSAIAVRMDAFVAPRCVASSDDVRIANITSRDAFVLSLIDGQLSLRNVLDISGLREDLVVTSIDRLARLGLVVVS